MQTWRQGLMWRRLFLKQHIQQRLKSTVYTPPERLYEVLNLKPGATKQNIKDAYIKLSKEFHPDRNPGNKKAEEKFVQINEAYTKIMNSLGTADPAAEIPDEYKSHIDYYHKIGQMTESLKYDPIRKKNIKRRTWRVDENDRKLQKFVDSLFKSRVFLTIICLLFLYKGISLMSRGTEQSTTQMDAADLIAGSKLRKKEKDRIAKEEKERQEFYKKWNIKS